MSSHIKAAFILSEYMQMDALDREGKIILLRHKISGAMAIRRKLRPENRGIFEYLKSNPHPSIARVLELVSPEEDEFIAIEEYVFGETLENAASRNLAFQDIIAWSLQLCDALEYLHSCDPPIIHRDIKPSNVMLDSRGRIVLIDFDAARFYTPATSSDTKPIGTPGYAPPEQYGLAQTDARTDIYALGSLLRTIVESCADQKADARYPEQELSRG